MTEPKTWTKHEVEYLVEQSIKETIADARERGIKWSARELAEMIYHDLNEESLIDRTP